MKHGARFRYNFFSRWLKSIEVVVDGALFEVWFRMPVICDFVLGSAKRDIEHKITFASPEEKAAEFLEMSLDIFGQTEHTRMLSKWEWPALTPVLPGFLRRPFNFFLKNDARMLMQITAYSLYVAVGVNFLLYRNMYLGEEDGEDEHGRRLSSEDLSSRAFVPTLHVYGFNVEKSSLSVSSKIHT